MRVLVLGATGMLGHEVCRTLAKDHEVTAACRNLDGIPESWLSCFDGVNLLLRYEASDERFIETNILTELPDVVINCIGVVKQLDLAKQAIHSIKLNSLLPHLLSKVCSERGIKLIQISTDCVFSGRKGLYTEDDEPDPVDLYGRSKLLGEVVEGPHLTIRTSIIGRQLRGQTSLLEWFRAQRGQVVQGYTKAIFSGLTTSALSEIIGRILTDFPDLSGLYHVSTSPINKHALLELINDRLHLGISIERDDSFVCDRSLDSSRFLGKTGIDIPTYDAMIGKLQEDEHFHD